MKIEDLKFYKNQNVEVATAVIDNEIHISGDTFLYQSQTVVVFSDLTKDSDDKESTKYLIKTGFLEPVNVKVKRIEKLPKDRIRIFLEII